jgi:hypothetical protein
VAANLIVTTAAILAGLLLCEGVLALLDYPPALTEDVRLATEYDSVRGWRNVPLGRARYVTSEFDVSLEYNERSYRGPLHEYPKPAGRYRVVLLGDSYLEGYTVALKDRVAEVAEAALQEFQRLRVEVIAFGTAGYSTDQELLWLESEGIRYTPDLVVVFFVDNDYWYNARAAYPRGPKPLFRLDGDSLVLTNVPVPRLASQSATAPGSVTLAARAKFFLNRHLYLYRLARRAVRRTAWLQALGGRLGLIEAPATVQTAAGTATVSSELTVFADPRSPTADSAVVTTVELLARMERRVRAAGGSLLVMHVPATPAIYPPGAVQSSRFQRVAPFGKPERSTSLFADVCQRAAVSCLDPTSRFVTAAESLAVNDQLLVFPEDEHWNVHGHRLAGLVLAEAIRAQIERAAAP